MRVEFWGVRGSIPSSHPGTVKYGGNTTCVEIRTRSNDHIILDAGSGIRRLGVQMMRRASSGDALAHLEKMVDFMVEDLIKQYSMEKPSSLRALEGSLDYKDDIHLFLTHYHWDHLQGFPFFVPAYVPGKKLNIYGQLKADHRLVDVMSGQMAKTYFPVYLDQMMSTRTYTELVDDTVKVGDITVACKQLNHPQGCLGYRITCGEMVVVMATDTEHYEKGLDENLLRLADGADILIYDSQYTPEEYESKKNWGHSTWEMGALIAKEAGAKKLVMCHHDPEHNDAFIDELEEKARQKYPNLIAAYEGLVLTDFPVEPTLDSNIQGPSKDELAESPEISRHNKLVTISCPAALRNIGDKEFLKAVKEASKDDTARVAFDCSAVKYSERHDMIALADAVLCLSGGGHEIEIKNASDALIDKLNASRFSTLAKTPKKRPAP